jgi:hypothetical protein
MAKRHLVPILLTSAVITLGGSLWAINNLPQQGSSTRPERPLIISKVQGLESAVQEQKAKDSTNTRAIAYYQHQLDSLRTSQEYVEQRAEYTTDSTKYEAQRAARESNENTQIYSTFALYGLGVVLFLTGLVTAFVRANRD